MYVVLFREYFEEDISYNPADILWLLEKSNIINAGDLSEEFLKKLENKSSISLFVTSEFQQTINISTLVSLFINFDTDLKELAKKEDTVLKNYVIELDSTKDTLEDLGIKFPLSQIAQKNSTSTILTDLLSESPQNLPPRKRLREGSSETPPQIDSSNLYKQIETLQQENNELKDFLSKLIMWLETPEDLRTQEQTHEVIKLINDFKISQEYSNSSSAKRNEILTENKALKSNLSKVLKFIFSPPGLFPSVSMTEIMEIARQFNSQDQGTENLDDSGKEEFDTEERILNI